MVGVNLMNQTMRTESILTTLLEFIYIKRRKLGYFITRIVSTITRVFRRIFTFLTKPSNQLQTPVDIRRARTLSLTSLVSILLFSFRMNMHLYFDDAIPIKPGPRLIYLLALGVVAIIYFVSRTKYFHVGSTTFVITVSAGVFGAILADPTNLMATEALVYLAISAILAAILLPYQAMIVVTMINLGGTLLLPYLLTSISHTTVLTAWAFLAIIHFLALTMSIALRSMYAKLTQQNFELQEFAHRAAHDLKTPIAGIHGYSHILLSEVDTLSSEDRHLYLSKIIETGMRMDTVINSMLLFAQAENKDVPVATVDMNGVIEEALARVAYDSSQKQIRILKVDTWPEVIGYEPWIVAVWTNLISNAIKYGGQIPTIELGFSNQYASDFIHFFVRDNGPGIPEEMHECIFEPHRQVKQGKQTGHGLGLSIVKRVVERFGGKVWVESSLSQGSTFIFSLPTDIPSTFK